jgi:hypothetical protein
MRRPTKSPFHRPAMQTLERLHSELGGQILENKEEAQRLPGRCFTLKPSSRSLTLRTPTPDIREAADG